jgi:ThiF family
VSSIELSRPTAAAAELTGQDASAIEHLFTTKRILLRLEPHLARSDGAAMTMTLLANEILRFCPNVTVDLPPDAHELFSELDQLAIGIHGASTITSATGEEGTFDAIVNIGTEIKPVPNWISVNANGWLCRVGTSVSETFALPSGYALANPFGELGAACLGAGQAFLALIGEPLLPHTTELSLYTLQQAAAGDLDPGPELAAETIELDALLVGCGGVGNGWVYAIKRAPLTGRVEPVDHQALRAENLGPYVCATRARLKEPKVRVVKEELEGRFNVVPRAERFRFFEARISYGQSYVPEIVISALDNPHTRHEVQRLWAKLTIDLAAKGLTSQILVKQLNDDGMCVITAHTDPNSDDAELQALSAATGLSVARLRNFESPITDEDITAAPPDKQQALEEARKRGRPICGHVSDLDMHGEEYTTSFAPAVPFVTAFAGTIAAAQTTKAKLEPLASLHFQFSFRSYRARLLTLQCDAQCECRQPHA